MNLIQLAQSRQRFWPAELFRDGSVGLFTCSDAALLRTDAAGTTPVAASGNYIGKHLDLSGNGYHFTQGTSTARFQFFGNYYKLDLTDDVMSTTLPAIASGTVVILTSNGAWFNSFSRSAGAFAWGPSSYTGGPSGLFTALREGANDYREIGRLVINRALTAAEKANLLAWAKALSGSSEQHVSTGGALVLPPQNLGTSQLNRFLNMKWITSLDVSKWDTSNVTSFTSFAHGCTNLTSLDVSGWNTSNVASFISFAHGCTNLTSLDVSGWNTSNVTSFISFANSCTNLTSLDVSGWNTSNVTNFSSFAAYCTNLTSLDVSGWNTSNVTSFNTFAAYCTNLTSLDVSGWNTSNVTSFTNFARGCTNLTSLTMSGGTGNPFIGTCVDYLNAFVGTSLNQATIDEILTRINSNGTSGGKFNQSGGSAPSVTGQVAITAMRARGWTVAVTGGF